MILDIKPSNILVNSKAEVKIADFGVSKELSNGTMARTFTGTQGYLAVRPSLLYRKMVCILTLLYVVCIYK